MLGEKSQQWRPHLSGRDSPENCPVPRRYRKPPLTGNQPSGDYLSATKPAALQEPTEKYLQDHPIFTGQRGKDPLLQIYLSTYEPVVIGVHFYLKTG
jgi:hypothetical protein